MKFQERYTPQKDRKRPKIACTLEERMTKMGQQEETDINRIIRRYDPESLALSLAQTQFQFADVTGYDFQTMRNQVADAESEFELLPSEIRNRFDNEISKLLDFVNDPENNTECVKLGLLPEIPAPKMEPEPTPTPEPAPEPTPEPTPES